MNLLYVPKGKILVQILLYKNEGKVMAKITPGQAQFVSWNYPVCADCDWLSQDCWPLIGLPGGRCGYNAPSLPGNAGYIVPGETPKQ